jgi:agmatinase
MNNFSLKKAVNMAPTGIATFAKTDICMNLESLEADIAIIGAPCDLAIQGKTGTRLGPRGIRLGSTRFSYKSGGSYDPERDTYYLDADIWKVIDCGDIDYIPGDLNSTFENIEAAVRIITDRKALPVILGGDHSITYPIIRGLDKIGDFDVIHIDSHLDWTDNIGGQYYSNGSPMRNISKLPYVKDILHLGIRGIGSSGRSDFIDARNNGDVIYSIKQVRNIGIEKIISDFKSDRNVFVTFDIDAMDYSIAAATGSPMFGGFLYEEMNEILEFISKQCNVIGFDFVEVAPPYDDAGSTTCYLAARLISDFLGFITKEKEKE